MNEPYDLVVNREKQVKLAQSRVAAVEKYYGLLCETLGSVIRKSARLRNKGDIFAHQLKDYAETEKLSSTTSSGLLSFAENFSAVQDYRNAEVQRLEAKVLQPMMKYGDICKTMKDSIKKSQSAWTREKKQSEKLRKLQQKTPSSTPQIVKAQAELQLMRKQAGSHEEQLITEVDTFENRKLTDMKSVLCEFVQIEMLFHARALKYLSRCYDAAQRIETEADMDYFRAAFLGAGGVPQTFPQAGNLNSQHFAHRTDPSTDHHRTESAMPRSMYDDADDSEDEDDDYDESEEDES